MTRRTYGLVYGGVRDREKRPPAPEPPQPEEKKQQQSVSAG